MPNFEPQWSQLLPMMLAEVVESVGAEAELLPPKPAKPPPTPLKNEEGPPRDGEGCNKIMTLGLCRCN